MSIMLDTNNALSASTTSITELISTVNVTPDMISRFGSERSARFGTIAANLNANDRDNAYTKCRLYAAWKDGYKEEHNRVYKNITELAENCGESRANFGLYAKVGKVFFSGEPAVQGWVDKRYNTAALFELSVIPPKVLYAVDELLSSGETRLSTTQCRVVKEAFSKGAGKDVATFLHTFVYKDISTTKDENGAEHEVVTLYTPSEFIDRVCNWKEYTASPNTTTSDGDGSATNATNAPGKSEKSGYSFYTVIRKGNETQGRLYADSVESEILNYIAANGYVVISTEHKSTKITRTLMHVRGDGVPDDILILTVSPYTVTEMEAVLAKYNEDVRRDMEVKGVVQYFRPYTPHEYVEATNSDNYADVLNIIESSNN